MKKKLLILFGFCAIFSLFAACGTQSSTTASQAMTTVSQTSTPTPIPTPQPKTAADVLSELKAKGLPVGESFAYTDSNDPNKLLGRPGQYVSKINFKDTRVVQQYVNNTGAKIEVSDGGSVETFASATDAQNRFKYIQAISKSSSMFAEYEYIQGDAILRISNDLTPAQAKVYADAFKQIVP